MDDIVIAAMAKWPHVPEVFGWLRLDGRGMWWLKHQRLNHVGMLDFIQRNYSQDAQGRPFFQNGPQRVFVDFDRAPYVARHTPQGVVLHHGEAVDSVTAAYLTPDGELWLSLSASRLAAVDDRDLAALAEGIHDTEGHAPSEADWAAWQIQQHALWLSVALTTTATPVRCPLLPIASMATLWAQHGIAPPPYGAPTTPA